MSRQESAVISFMAVASQNLLEGNAEYAKTTCESIAEIPGQYQRHARLRAAIATHQMGQFKEAESKLEELLQDEDQVPQGTVFRADVLRWLAYTRFALGKPEIAGDVLEEAAVIYDHQGELPRLGSITEMQAQLTLRQGRPEDAARETEKGARLIETATPPPTPLSFGSGKKVGDATKIAAFAGAATS